MAKAAVTLATLTASVLHADAEFSEADFGGLSKSVIDLLDAIPGARIVVRGVKFLGGISDLVSAGRRIRQGRADRAQREEHAARMAEVERIRRSTQGG